jgi:hypothetical protein
MGAAACGATQERRIVKLYAAPQYKSSDIETACGRRVELGAGAGPGGGRCCRNKRVDQVEQARRDADAAYPAEHYRSKQREHRGHHKEKFHANLLLSKYKVGHRGRSFRAVQRIPSGDCAGYHKSVSRQQRMTDTEHTRPASIDSMGQVRVDDAQRRAGTDSNQLDRLSWN